MKSQKHSQAQPSAMAFPEGEHVSSVVLENIYLDKCFLANS